MIIYSVYFWLNLRYIQKKQQYYIGTLKSLEKKVYTVRKFHKNIRKFLKNVEDIFELLKEIRDYNRFWSKYITITLATYSSEICYVVYANSTSTFNERIQLIPLSSFCLVYVIYIQIISSECSKIIANNNKIYQQIRRINYCYKGISLRTLFQFQKAIHLQNILQKTGFRLPNGQKINNKLFEMIGSWMVFFSLKLFSRD